MQQSEIRQLILCWKSHVKNTSIVCYCQTCFKMTSACCRYSSYTEMLGNDSKGSVVFKRIPKFSYRNDSVIPSCMFAWVRGKLFSICPGLWLFLSMKSRLKCRKEGPVRFSVWLNTLQPRSVSGVSCYFGTVIWCLPFSLFWVIFVKTVCLA